MPIPIFSRRSYGAITQLGIQFGAGPSATRYLMEFATDEGEDGMDDALAEVAAALRKQTPCGVATARVQEMDEKHVPLE